MLKRSRDIKLLLLGSLSGALSGCDPQRGARLPLSTEAVYTNNFHIPGAGYYHAPFRAWYPFPYNHFDSQTQRYFYGGQWGTAPWRSITNLSNPTPPAVREAGALRTDIARGGFGSSSSSRSIYS